MLLHFQLQELKTEDLSGSVLIALQRYFDSSSCWSRSIQWHFQTLRIYLHDFVSYDNHSQPFVCWASSAPQPLGCWGSGTPQVLLLRLLGGMRAGPGRTLECGGWHTAPVSRVQKAGLGAPAPRVPHVRSIPHPLRARCQPRRAAASSRGLLAAFVRAVLMARSILCRLKCQTTRVIHPGQMYAFSLFLSFPLNPTAAKGETMPSINTDGTTLLLRQIRG